MARVITVTGRPTLKYSQKLIVTPSCLARSTTIKFATDPGHHGLQTEHSMVLAQWQKAKDGKLARQVVWPKAAQSADLIYPINAAAMH